MDKPSNLLYRLYYLRRLRRLSATMSRFVNLEELQKVKTIKDFDELVTAPLAGFDDAFHYYREVSSLSLLPRIRVPVMLLHSRDDPLLPWEPLAGPLVSGNHFLLAHLTDSGGHAAFLARKQRNDFDRSWAENRVIDFFQMALDS
jgi:predicted alpha/beta-fold hydrolase